MKKLLFIFYIFIGQLLALNLDFDTFSSDFTQKVKSKNSTLFYSGHFTLSKNQAYWIYDTPNKKEIFINKNEIIIVEHDLEQAIFSRLENIPNLNRIFEKAKYITDNKFIAKYENIDYIITLNKDEIQSIFYKDGFENDILITLSNQTKNSKIDMRIFEAKIPQNYDIIR